MCSALGLKDALAVHRSSYTCSPALASTTDEGLESTAEPSMLVPNPPHQPRLTRPLHCSHKTRPPQLPPSALLWGSLSSQVLLPHSSTLHTLTHTSDLHLCTGIIPPPIHTCYTIPLTHTYKCTQANAHTHAVSHPYILQVYTNTVSRACTSTHTRVRS